MIVKIILLRLSLALSMSFADKTQYFVHLSFNSILQLINDISRDHQKLLKYFNGTAIVGFFRIPLPWFGVGLVTLVSNNLALYLKDLKSSLVKLVASSLESNHKLPVVSE